jgi:hypothetical protein
MGHGKRGRHGKERAFLPALISTQSIPSVSSALSVSHLPGIERTYAPGIDRPLEESHFPANDSRKSAQCANILDVSRTEESREGLRHTRDLGLDARYQQLVRLDLARDDLGEPPIG